MFAASTLGMINTLAGPRKSRLRKLDFEDAGRQGCVPPHLAFHRKLRRALAHDCPGLPHLFSVRRARAAETGMRQERNAGFEVGMRKGVATLAVMQMLMRKSRRGSRTAAFVFRPAPIARSSIRKTPRSMRAQPTPTTTKRSATAYPRRLRLRKCGAAAHCSRPRCSPRARRMQCSGALSVRRPNIFRRSETWEATQRCPGQRVGFCACGKGLTGEPGPIFCRLPTMMRSPSLRPFSTLTSSPSAGPSVTGRCSAFSPLPTT